MKQLVALFAAVLLSGCVVPAANQTLQTPQNTQAVEQAYALCKSVADSSPVAIKLSEYLVLGKSKNTNYLEKIAHKSYATGEQIADIQSYQADLNLCRAKAVDDLQAVDRDYAMLASAYFTEDDKITADVINKKITIGEANCRVTKSEYAFSLKAYNMKK
jgi:hypothetical protein